MYKVHVEYCSKRLGAAVDADLFMSLYCQVYSKVDRISGCWWFEAPAHPGTRYLLSHSHAVGNTCQTPDLVVRAPRPTPHNPCRVARGLHTTPLYCTVLRTVVTRTRTLFALCIHYAICANTVQYSTYPVPTEYCTRCRSTRTILDSVLSYDTARYVRSYEYHSPTPE